MYICLLGICGHFDRFTELERLGVKTYMKLSVFFLIAPPPPPPSFFPSMDLARRAVAFLWITRKLVERGRECFPAYIVQSLPDKDAQKHL